MTYWSSLASVSHLLIYFHAPSYSWTHFPLHSLKKLASRQQLMQTHIGTKSSFIAWRLAAVVVTTFLLFVWILQIPRDFSFKKWRRSVTLAPAYIFVCLPPTCSKCLFLLLTISLYLSHYISLPTEVWGSFFLSPSTSLSDCVSALGQR